jgi:hypothetical protein
MEEEILTKTLPKETDPSFVSPSQKKKAILESVTAYVRGLENISEQVDKILNWIKEEERKLDKNPNHKAFLSLDFDYTDTFKRVVVDTILRLLGTRLLTDEERADPLRPPATGLQATNRPHLFIYYEHQRPRKEGPIQEKYTLFVSREMKLPVVISPQKIEEVEVKETEEPIAPKEEEIKLKEFSPPPLTPEEVASPPPEVVEKETLEQKEKKKPPGIFETINKVLLGEDEDYY